MRNKEDQRIKTIFPHIKGRTIIYVGDSNNLPIGLEDSIRHRFSSIGYRLIVLPNLLCDLSPEIVAYLFPGFDYSDLHALEDQIKHRAGLDGKTGFLYKKTRYWYFRFREVISPMSAYDEAVILSEELISRKRPFHYLWRKIIDKGSEISLESIYDRIELEEEDEDVRVSPHYLPTEYSFSEERPSYKEPKSAKAKPVLKYKVSPDNLDPHTQEVLSEINRLLEVYDLTLEELEVIIGYTVKLSKMKITRNGNIIMTDFGNREIKMDHLTKMVYFFYLRHPEGVRFKEVDNYREQLIHIYMGITGRDDPQEIRNSVIGHIDPYGSGLRISASRIKKAFRDQFGEKVARYYCLEGKKGEPYSIAIDRDFVIWEYPD